MTPESAAVSLTDQTPGGEPALTAAPAWRVHATLLFVQLAFGGFHVVAKAVLSSLPPLALAGLRVALATPFLVLLAWRHDRVIPARRDLPWLALLGGLGVTANQLLFISGLHYTTATNAAILMPSMPVFAVAAGALLGVERIGPRRLFGIALSVAGALVLVNPIHLSEDHGAVMGNGLILGNCLCYALFLVLQRPILERVPWRTLIAWSFVFGGGAVLLASAPTLIRLDYGAVPAGAWWGVAYIVALATVFAYAASTWAVRRSSPALVAAFTTLQPLAAAGLAALFLGERFGWVQGLGFTLIIGGLWRVSARPRTGAI
jgi:drug/metabolite transporter (DMT)-like permease